MKTFVAQLVLAAVLLGGGEIFRRAAHIEQRLASAEEALATLALDAADAQYKEVEEDMGIAARLPIVGALLLADVRQAQAMLAYWRGDYQSVPKESDLVAEDVRPDLLFLAANATFRSASGRPSGPAAAQELDNVLRMYTILLKKDPGFVDGSFNYEYVARLRNTLAKASVPEGWNFLTSSLLGGEGSPPEDTPPEDFNMIVPLTPDERPEEDDSGAPTTGGTGAPRNRKG